MRKLVITQNITLDGSIEMLTDWFNPQNQSGTDMDDVVAELARQDSQADALLLGRRTFEDFRGYWPLQTDDTTGITDHLNRVRKYVVSGTLTDPGWENSTVLGGDPVAQVSALKARTGGEGGGADGTTDGGTGGGTDIVLTGSITLAHAMIAAGLVDEYRLFCYPAVQGRGRRLFPEGHEIPRLRLLAAQTFRSGITLHRYAPA